MKVSPRHEVVVSKSHGIWMVGLPESGRMCSWITSRFQIVARKYACNCYDVIGSLPMKSACREVEVRVVGQQPVIEPGAHMIIPVAAS